MSYARLESCSVFSCLITNLRSSLFQVPSAEETKTSSTKRRGHLATATNQKKEHGLVLVSARVREREREREANRVETREAKKHAKDMRDVLPAAEP